MNILQSTRLRIWYAFLAFSLGCATDGARPASQTSPVLSPPPAASSTTVQKPDRTPGARSLVDSTPYKTEWPKSELTPASYSQDSSLPEPLAAGALDEPLPEELTPLPETDQPDATSGMTLEALQQLALANNPSIRQASDAARKAMGIRTQVGLKANPVLGYFGEEMGNEQSGGLQGVFASQTFVTGGKLALNRDVLSQDVQAVLWEVEAQRYRVQTDVRRLFYEALAAQRRLELASNFQEVARKGAEIAEDRLRALEGSRPDVLQAEIQLNEVDLITQRARIGFETTWRELASVAGAPHMPPPTLVGSLEGAAALHDVETTYAELLARSPELQAARARVQRARANLARQQVEPIPNLQAQVGFGHDTGTDDAFANVQLGLPLPIHNKNQGNICAAQAEYSRAVRNVQRVELSLRARLAQAVREYDVAQVTVDRYQNQILPKADESLELSEEAYVAGEFDFLRVLVVRRAYFDANLNYVAALADLAKADALIDGLLLTGGLTDPVDFEGGDDLRGQALSGQ